MPNLRAYKHHYDLIIDEINTRPFLVPKFVREKQVIAIIHQLAREFWFYETKFPLNYIGYYYFKKMVVKLQEYNNTGAIPFHQDRSGTARFQKSICCATRPTAVFIGRLKKAKLPHHALQAFSIIKREIHHAKMWIIGDGYFRKKLESFETKDVTFYGHISNKKI